MVIEKKKIIIFSLVFLLCLGFGLTFKLSGVEENQTNSVAVNNNNNNSGDEKELMPGEAVAVSTTNDELAVAKNNREIARSKSAELLRSLIDDDNASSESKKDAENSIIKLAGEIDKELKIEALLLAKGYKDTVAFVSEDSTTVTIKCQKLESKDMAKITDIIYEITGNNIIKIVEVN